MRSCQRPCTMVMLVTRWSSHAVTCQFLIRPGLIFSDASLCSTSKNNHPVIFTRRLDSVLRSSFMLQSATFLLIISRHRGVTSTITRWAFSLFPASRTSSICVFPFMASLACQLTDSMPPPFASWTYPVTSAARLSHRFSSSPRSSMVASVTGNRDPSTRAHDTGSLSG
jgi:hypothetical protein